MTILILKRFSVPEVFELYLTYDLQEYCWRGVVEISQPFNKHVFTMKDKLTKNKYKILNNSILYYKTRWINHSNIRTQSGLFQVKPPLVRFISINKSKELDQTACSAEMKNASLRPHWNIIKPSLMQLDYNDLGLSTNNIAFQQIYKRNSFNFTNENQLLLSFINKAVFVG